MCFLYRLIQSPINNVVLGEGAFSKVKVGMMQTRELVALKIQPESIKRPCSVQSSFWTNYELGLSLSLHYRNHAVKSYKAYSLMRYLGRSLYQQLYFSQPNITDGKRLEWASKMAFQVHKLHEGWQSSRGVQYVHSDIHMNNFTIDSHYRIRLIDFDFSSPLHNMNKVGLSGAKEYMPYEPFDYSNSERDLFALSRTLYFPKTYAYYGKKSGDDRSLSLNNLLTDKVLDTYALRPFIDTSLERENTRKKISALRMACLLALASVKQEALIDLCDSDEKCYAVMTLLHANQLESLIKNLFSNKELVSELARIAPIAAWLQPDFLQKSLKTKAGRFACCALASTPLSKRYLLVESVNKRGIFPYYPSLESLNEMIDNATDCNNSAVFIDKYNLLSISVAYNKSDLLQECLLLGGNPNKADPFGYTPLMDALWQNKRECYMTLLRHKAIDVKVLHPNGYHAEIFCRTNRLPSEQSTKDFEQYLFLREYLDHSKTCQNSSDYLDPIGVVHKACQQGYYGLVEELLALNANINQQDDKGNTPLMIAIEYDQLKCMDVLLNNEEKLDFQLENNNGVRALDLFYRKLDSNPALSIFEDKIEALSLIKPLGCFCF